MYMYVIYICVYKYPILARKTKPTLDNSIEDIFSGGLVTNVFGITEKKKGESKATSVLVSHLCPQI